MYEREKECEKSLALFSNNALCSSIVGSAPAALARTEWSFGRVHIICDIKQFAADQCPHLQGHATANRLAFLSFTDSFDQDPQCSSHTLSQQIKSKSSGNKG